MATAPKYDLRSVDRDDVLALFETCHAYKSLSASCTYLYAVIEKDHPVAAYAWQPPAFGAAKSACPIAPQGVLALSRMVAVDKKIRALKHISKPLRRQMNHAIDRTRWPVLITYSDEGEGHNGFVYECSGWIKTTRALRPFSQDDGGARRSSYSNGRHGGRDLSRAGFTWIQRWENRVCERGDELAWMESHGWRRVALPGRVWASGRQAYTYVREAAA